MTASRRSASDAVVATLLGVLLFAFVLDEIRTGLRFPIPWSDEGSFLWPALAFRDRFRLFAPEIHPHRDALWMPPLFMVLYGIIFKVVPFSLLAARAVSSLLLASAATMTIGIVRVRRVRIADTFVLGAFFSIPIVRLAGNVARMESLVLALATGGFFLLRRRRLAGLAMLFLAPLAHPNGCFVLVGGIVCVIIAALTRPLKFESARTKTETIWGLRFSPKDVAISGFVLASWVAYAWYVKDHWEAFKVDMIGQLVTKMSVSYSPTDGSAMRLSQAPILIGMIALVVGAALGWRSRSDVVVPVMLAGSLFLQTAVTAGWLYEIYTAFALLVSGTVLVETAMAALAHFVRRDLLALIGVGLGLSVAGLLALAGRDQFLTRSVTRSTIARRDHAPEYLTREDRDIVSQRLRALSRERGRISVQFVPAGEGLEYESLRSPALGIVEQTFYADQFDVIMAHDSVWLPKWIGDLELLHFLVSAGTPVPKAERIWSRDNTEQWSIYLFPPLRRSENGGT